MSKLINKDILRCPSCKQNDLEEVGNLIICNCCKKCYDKVNNTYLFVNYGEEAVVDSLDKLKFFLKKFGKIYNLLIFIVSPVLIRGTRKKFLKEYLGNNKKMVAINLGSGSSNISDHISNIDMFNYNNVNLTSDISNLPFKDNSIDIVINEAVLEHVPSPEQVVQEINRVLKKGGVVYSYFPFIQGFHASPYDFTRVTYEGIKNLYKEFDIQEIKIGAGPVSGFMWVLQEFIAMLLSFGIKPLYKIIYLFIMILTFPIKFLDILLVHHPMAKNICSAFVIIAKKK